MAFRECPKRWYIDHVLKQRGRTHSVHMDFGTAVHSVLELLKGRNIKERPAVPGDMFEQIFVDLLWQNGLKYRDREREDLAKLGKGKGVDFYIRAGRNILARFDECDEIRTAEVVYNEYRLDVPIDRDDGVSTNFKGYVDMVIKTKDARGNTILYVCDFKSCSWGWPREKRENRDLHFQILLYKHFLCKRFGLDPKLVRTAFVLLKKRPSGDSPPVEFFPISAGPVSVQRALDEINSDITLMAEACETGEPRKNLKACRNDYGDVCPHAGTARCDAPLPK